MEEQNKPIKLRGHHLYQLYSYFRYDRHNDFGLIKRIASFLTGKSRYGNIARFGYTPEQIASTKRTLGKILDNPEIKVQIVDSYDDICSTCRGYGCGDNVQVKDAKSAEFMGLEIGREYTAKEICDRLFIDNNGAGLLLI